MAILWERSIVPWLNANGTPYSGAKVYFYEGGTTTPLVTYTDPALSIPHDHPVVANSAGMFPAVFIPEQITYKFRVTTSDGALVSEVDGVSAPTTVPPEFPDSDTPVEERFQTGDIKIRWSLSAPTGWVRVNGRTIGSASSGATERANADCEDLFEFLWNNDSTLAVSGGRGGTAAGDWAANKTIALPDPRGRALVVLDAFGNSAAGRVTDAILGADSDTLGAAGGAETHTLIEDELPSHKHGLNGIKAPNHGHPWRFGRGDADISHNSGGLVLVTDDNSNQAAYTGTPSATLGQQIGGSGDITITGELANTGADNPHNNLQPSIMIPLFMKL